MALIFLDGFDSYGASIDLTTKWAALGPVFTYDATAGKYGGKAFKWTSQGGGDTAGLSIPNVGVLNGNEVYMGFWFKAASKVGINTPQSGTIVFFTDSTNDYRLSASGVLNAAFGVSSSGFPAIKKWRGDWFAWDYTGAVDMCDNAYHWVEIYMKSATSGGVVQVYVDGTLTINASGATANTTTPTFNKVSFGDHQTGTIVYTIDDLVIWDNSGSGLLAADFPLGSAQRIVTVLPNGDTSDKDFTRSTGSDNYALVDEAAVNQDTDYVESAVVGDLDLYDFAAMGVTPSAIKCVVVNACVKSKNGSTGITAKLTASSNGDVAQSAAKSVGAAYKTIQHCFKTDPDNGSAWTESAVNAAKFGLERTA